jgi:hypothetical protein
MLCFGGPLNEKLYGIPEDQHHITALARRPDAVFHRVVDEASLVETKQLLYYRKRFFKGPFEFEALVVQGFPVHRITDALDAICGLCFYIEGWR